MQWVNIIFSDGARYGGNPIFLHSQLLRQKSKFFEALLSERWSGSSDKDAVDVDITVASLSSSSSDSDVNVDKYIKCISFMEAREGKRLCFSGVDEALEILSAASEWLFDDAIREALLYLEAIPWTPNQKLQIRALLSSLELNINMVPDLAARLTNSVSDVDEDLKELKNRLEKMLSTTVSQVFMNSVSPVCFRNKITDFIVSIFDASSPFQDTCRDALLKGYRNVINTIKTECMLTPEDISHRSSRCPPRYRVLCESLLWLLDLLKLCETELLQKALQLLCEDAEFARLILITESSRKKAECASYSLLDILNNRFMKDLATGKILTTKSERISFLKNWVPVIAYLTVRINGYKCTTAESRWPWDYSYVIDVLKTLPPTDQKEIFKLWRALKKFRRIRLVD